ncbi:MAG: hypothetical protein HQK54_09415, partial [Oligoflexales bacterium]|nr:hypothetical protein [Oligoflexales bacterium]
MKLYIAIDAIKKYAISIICLMTAALSCSRREIGENRIPEVIGGVVNLDGFDFEKSGPVKLDGDWEFYWDQLLYKKDFLNDNNMKKEYIKVPSNWVTGNNYPMYGKATYRLKVLGNKNRTVLALKTFFISSMWKIYVDDKLIQETGITDETENFHLGRYESAPEFNLTEPTDSFDIIIQVSNSVLIFSGLVDSIFLGTKRDLIMERDRVLLIEVFLLGGFIMIALYHFNFFFQRPSERSYLFFGLFSLAVTVFVSLGAGQSVQFLFNGEFNGPLWLRTWLGSGTLATILMLPFIHSVFPDDYSTKIL